MTWQRPPCFIAMSKLGTIRMDEVVCLSQRSRICIDQENVENAVMDLEFTPVEWNMGVLCHVELRPNQSLSKTLADRGT